jgi:hypothetical protein
LDCHRFADIFLLLLVVVLVREKNEDDTWQTIEVPHPEAGSG